MLDVGCCCLVVVNQRWCLERERERAFEEAGRPPFASYWWSLRWRRSTWSLSLTTSLMIDCETSPISSRGRGGGGAYAWWEGAVGVGDELGGWGEMGGGGEWKEGEEHDG